MDVKDDFDLIDVRASLGLARGAFAKMLGWTESKVWAIEKGRKEITASEVDHVNTIVAARVGATTEEVEADTLKARDRFIRDTPEGATRLVDWNGISHGDVIRVKGLEGTFKFLFHHSDARQEYVQLYGGPKGHALMRSVRPEKVIVRGSRTNSRRRRPVG